MEQVGQRVARFFHPVPAWNVRAAALCPWPSLTFLRERCGLGGQERKILLQIWTSDHLALCEMRVHHPGPPFCSLALWLRTSIWRTLWKDLKFEGTVYTWDGLQNSTYQRWKSKSNVEGQPHWTTRSVTCTWGDLSSSKYLWWISRQNWDRHS